MMRLGLVTLMVFSVQAPAAEAPKALTDARLAAVTAAGVTEASTGSADQGPLLIADEARVQVRFEDRVTVGEGQRDLQAASLSNLSGGLLQQGVNVFDASTRLGSIESVEARAEQINTLEAALGRVGSLAGFAAEAATSVQTESSYEQGRRTWSSTATFQVDRREAEQVSHTELDVQVAAVPALGPIEVDLSQAGNNLLVPDFTVDLPDFRVDTMIYDRSPVEEIVDLLFPRDGAIASEVSGRSLSFNAAHLDLGSVRLDGADIVIGPSTLSLPGFSIGDVTLGTEVCRLFNCSEPSIRIGQVTFEDSRIELAETRFAGANPIPGITGFGAGFAMVGSGRISAEDGLASVQADLQLPLDELLAGAGAVRFVVPWAGIQVFEGDGLTDLDDGVDDLISLLPFWSGLPSLELSLDLEVPITFPDGFTGEFEGAICLSQEDCGEMQASSALEEHREQSRRDLTDSGSDEWVQWHDVTIATSSAAVSLEAAAADVIVLDDAKLEQSEYRIVALTGEAQRGLRLLNGINAAVAEIGNGLNVMRFSSGSTARASGNTQLRQQNQISQIGRFR